MVELGARSGHVERWPAGTDRSVDLGRFEGSGRHAAGHALELGLALGLVDFLRHCIVILLNNDVVLDFIQLYEGLLHPDFLVVLRGTHLTQLLEVLRLMHHPVPVHFAECIRCSYFAELTAGNSAWGPPHDRRLLVVRTLIVEETALPPLALSFRVRLQLRYLELSMAGRRWVLRPGLHELLQQMKVILTPAEDPHELSVADGVCARDRAAFAKSGTLSDLLGALLRLVRLRFGPFFKTVAAIL